MRRKRITMAASVLCLLMMAACSSNQTADRQQIKQVEKPRQSEAPTLQEQTEATISKEQIRGVEVTVNGTDRKSVV